MIGESWDVADLTEDMTTVPYPVSRITDGPFAGRTLHDLVATSSADLLGDAEATSRFPLLVKHLDAREHLSVQVHPPPGEVARHPGAHHKTESWVVMAAEPGSELYLGLNPGVAFSDLVDAAGSAAVVPLLRRVPARPGAVHHVPAGLVHALGAGVLVAEVQTPSDTTYRLYDWSGEYQRPPRELHIEPALDSIRAAWATNVDPPEATSADGLLVSTDSYQIVRRRATSARRIHVAPRPFARVVLVLSGRITGPSLGASLETGQVVVLPAVWSGEMWPRPGAVWIEIDLIGARGDV